MQRRIILAATAVTAALVLPAAASAATPGSTPTGVSTSGEPPAPTESKVVDPPACGMGDILLTQAGPELRWSLAPLGRTETRTLVTPPVDPPAKDGESELEDRLREQRELMDRLNDILNRFNEGRDRVAGGIG